MIGGGTIKNTGGVGDSYTGGLGGIQVDIVVPHSHIGDHLQLVSRGGQQCGIHPFGERDDSGTGAGDAGLQFGTARRVLVPGPHRDAQRPQMRHGAIGQQTGDVDQPVGIVVHWEHSCSEHRRACSAAAHR